MMIADLPLISDPPAIIIEARKRTGRSSRRDPAKQSRSGFASGALFVGAMVILTGDDAQPYLCEIIGQAADGTWLCVRPDRP